MRCSGWQWSPRRRAPSISPYLSRYFLSICPYLSRYFLSISLYFSRYILSICKGISRRCLCFGHSDITPCPKELTYGRVLLKKWPPSARWAQVKYWQRFLPKLVPFPCWPTSRYFSHNLLSQTNSCATHILTHGKPEELAYLRNLKIAFQSRRSSVACFNTTQSRAFESLVQPQKAWR